MNDHELELSIRYSDYFSLNDRIGSDRHLPPEDVAIFNGIREYFSTGKTKRGLNERILKRAAQLVAAGKI